MDQQTRLTKDFLCKEFSIIHAPNNPSLTHSFNHTEELIECLIDFLKYETNEPLVEGLESKVLNSIAIFSGTNLKMEDLPRAIENLATAFESFLKKIALIKYSDQTVILYGDGLNYAGYLKTTLGKLLAGKVEKLKRNAPDLSAPIVSFSYSGVTISELIYNEARELRNDVHNAKLPTIVECISVFKTVVSAYLFALNENISLIRKKVSPLFIYMDRLVNDYKKWEIRYIELSSEERLKIDNNMPVLQALEWIDTSEEVPVLLDEAFSIEEEMDNYEKSKRVPLKKSVVELHSQFNQFWLVGEPGAGKSTSLQNLALIMAKTNLQSGFLDVPLPFYLSAKQYSKSNSFKEILVKGLKVTQDVVSELLEKNRFFLLLDGFNEISKSEKNNAIKDMHNLLEDYADINIAISSRKYGFKEVFNLPVFELLPLTNSMIEEYIKKQVQSSQKAIEIYDDLIDSNYLILDLARNPLMLQMLIRVVQEGNSPQNRGQLFFYFTNWFLDREKKVSQFSTVVKESALSCIAFNLRSKGVVTSHKGDILSYIKDELDALNSKVDVSELYDELLNNRILEIDNDGRVIFFHELMLEYFSAMKLQVIYSRNNNQLAKDYFIKVEWSEPIIMLSGIVDDATRLVQLMFKVNIILAARCISAGAKILPIIISNIIDLASEYINKGTEEKEDAITALLELGRPNSLRVVAKIPAKKFDKSLPRAISNCQRPEIAAQNLLRFGLTGKSRIRQCLSVFYRKPISETLLNSVEVANAEYKLLENANEIDFQDLELIDDIGIAQSIRGHVGEIIKKIVFEQNINSPLWRKAVRLAGNHNFINENVEIIIQRLTKEGIIEGTVFYSVFVACNELKSTEIAKTLISNSLNLCLNNGYYSLAIKFAKEFDLKKRFECDDMITYIEKIVSNGQIALLFQFKELNTERNFDNYIKKAIDVLIFKKNIQPLLQLSEKIMSYIEDRKDMLKMIIIDNSTKLKMKPSATSRSIKLLNLQECFSDCLVINFYDEERGYGFANDIFNNQGYFFRKSDILNLKNRKIEIRMIANYSIIKVANSPKKRSVVRLTLFDSSKVTPFVKNLHRSASKKKSEITNTTIID